MSENMIRDKVLIVNLGGIGDIILSFPAFKLLKKNYGDIYFLGVTRTQKLMEYFFPEFKIIIFPFAPSEYTFNNALQFLRILFYIKKISFDAVFNFRPLVSIKSAIPIYLICQASGAKIKAGRSTEGRGIFFNYAIKEKLLEEKFEGDYNLELAEKVTGETRERDYSLSLNEEIKERVQRFKLPSSKKVGICMGGSLAKRLWGIENYGELIDRILGQTECCIMLFGEENEKKLYNKEDNRIWDYRGRTDVLDLMALISETDIFISNDTGPMHIACALDKKVIALFREYAYGHFSWKRDGIFNLVAKDVKDIAIDDVWGCLKKYLEEIGK